MEILTTHNLPLSRSKLADFGGEIPLQESVRSYLEGAFSANTRKAYRLDMDHFRAWGGDVPASPELIAQYVACHGGFLSAATMARRLVAIGKAHTSRGLTNPCTTELVRGTLRGVRRTHGISQRQAKPLLVQDLLAILDQIGPNTRDIRDRVVLLIGFAGAFRRSELVGLDVSDVEQVPQGIIVTVQRSKTDQEAAGRRIGIPYARGRHCPVHAVQEWLAVARIDQGPLFRPVDRHGHVADLRLSSQAISTIIKERVSSLGHDPTEYSGHSLRAGLATSAAIAGLSSWKIRQQTGHASDAMLARYIREGELFRGNVAGSLL